MNRIVECVPNFSEGRRPEVIDAIVRAIATVPGVVLLDREMDADHNRAVLTIAGPPESIGEAALRAIAVATQTIDLTQHHGEHPRIGATDVVPFVPIRGVTIEECIAIARNVGQRIADELHIPVYLYESAATRRDRVNLEDIRRGQFEGLAGEIATNPDRFPDFGTAHIHPTAGAIAVGARKPLIAYNINLNTADVNVAKEIARRVRFSSGGFHYVKAIGIFLKDRNQAQVSMNLTDYEQTPVEMVFDAVRKEAELLGTGVASSEIIGLIPQHALEKAAEFYLQIEHFKPSMVLETRLAETIRATTPKNDHSIRSFVELLAAADPAPGSSGVAALSGALGAALGQRSIRHTNDSKEHREYTERYADALDRLAPYTSTLLDLIDTDAEIQKQVMAAYRIPRESSDRDIAFQETLIRATEISSRTASCSAETLRILEDMRPLVHNNAGSDLQVGLGMLRSSLRGAIANMRVHLLKIMDSEIRLRYEDMITGWEHNLKG